MLKLAFLFALALAAEAATPAIALSWTAPVQPADIVTHAYRVYRSIFADPPGSPNAQWAQVASGVTNTTWTDNLVTSGMTYYYYVTDVDTTQPRRRESAPSNITSTTP